MHIGPVLLLWPLLVAQGPPAGASAAPPPTLVRIEIQVAGAERTIMSYGLTGTEGFTVFAFEPEDRPETGAVIGGYGRSAGAGGRAGLSALFFVHFYLNGESYFEGQILNDSMQDPPGKLRADYSVTFRGANVAAGSAVFVDQAGIGFWAGTPRFAPRAKLWSEYIAQLPDPQTLTGIDRDDAEKVEDPDSVHNTHQTGSPRNRYVAVEAAKYRFTEDERYLERLLDFVAAQARRPYHLAERSGEPFYHERYPGAHFIEGRPERRATRETFGRTLLSETQLEGNGLNGWDHEHANVEELYAAYMMLGSRIARREMVLIAEELLSTPYVGEEGKHQHSARAFGWVARTLTRVYQATGEVRYLDAVRRMVRSLQAHWRPEGRFPYLLAQPPRGDHIDDEQWESPFMVAVAASAIALYLRVSPDDEKAREVLTFCGDLLVDQGYSPESGGFYYDYSVESSKKTGDGSVTNGVVLWIPSALVEVAEFLPEEQRSKYLDPARRIYDANRGERWGKPSSPVFHRWLLRAAKEFE